MKRHHRESASPKLKELRDRIDHWRATRTKRTPMPPELWEETIALAREYGFSPVAHALSLNCASIKQRLASPTAIDKTPVACQASFVELPVRPMPPNENSTSLTVTLSDAAGNKMELRWHDASTVDITGLLKNIWAQRP